ncbi:hypothetical protein T265_12735, partial [Opisthorchis viverrini]
MDEKKFTAYFLHFVGKQAYTLIKNLVYPESPIDISYTALKKKVLQHFKPINFVAAERARFNMLTRSHSQSVRDFVLRLQTQAAKCDYGAQLEEQLRDRLIAGIQLPELQHKRLLCPDQKFQTIRKICEQYEDVKHVTKTEEADLLNYSKTNNSRMRTNNKFKPRTDSRASNPSTRHFIDQVKALSEDISTLSLSVLSQNSSHVFKTLISASGQKHDFIVDNGSVESIIPQSDLTAFYPSAVI